MPHFSNPNQVRPRGRELFFVTPIILGGDANAPENITYLNRRQHIEAVRYWNRIVFDLRKKQKPQHYPTSIWPACLAVYTKEATGDEVGG
mgnify:CR=1 FL=1